MLGRARCRRCRRPSGPVTSGARRHSERSVAAPRSTSETARRTALLGAHSKRRHSARRRGHLAPPGRRRRGHPADAYSGSGGKPAWRPSQRARNSGCRSSMWSGCSCVTTTVSRPSACAEPSDVSRRGSVPYPRSSTPGTRRARAGSRCTLGPVPARRRSCPNGQSADHRNILPELVVTGDHVRPARPRGAVPCQQVLRDG